MVYQFVVPGPIEDVEEVRVLEWHLEEGSAFEAEALLVELETHKAVVEFRTLSAGVFRRIICAAGSWQKIGLPIALITDAADEALPAEPGPGPDLPFMAVEFEIT